MWPPKMKQPLWLRLILSLQVFVTINHLYWHDQRSNFRLLVIFLMKVTCFSTQSYLVAKTEYFTSLVAYRSCCLSPVSVVFNGWESLTPLDRTLIHRGLAPSRHWYSFTDLERIEIRLSTLVELWEGQTNVQVSAEPGVELGTVWLKIRDYTNHVVY